MNVIAQAFPENKENDQIQKTDINQYRGFTAKEILNFHKKLEEESLLWLEGRGDLARYAFLHLTEFQEHSILNKGKNITPLPEFPRAEVEQFLTTSRLGKMPLNAYILKDEVDGLIILHHGKIVFEAYPRMYPNDHHIWFSVSKTLVSTAIGILEDREFIDVNRPIDFYFEELRESGWEGVPIVDIMSMSSGIACEEVYTLPEAECYFKTRAMYGWPKTNRASANPLDAFSRLDSHQASGEVFEYTSVNTMLLTLLIERITNKPYRQFIQKEIWDKIGVESVGLLLNGAYGRDGSWLGINSTLRDLGRFGLLFTPAGRQVDNPVISDTLLNKIQEQTNKKLASKSWFSEEFVNHGYQWDEVYSDGDFYKHGHCAQGLYISPSRDLVIAFFGTKSEDFTENQLPFISRQLAISGLFED